MFQTDFISFWLLNWLTKEILLSLICLCFIKTFSRVFHYIIFLTQNNIMLSMRKNLWSVNNHTKPLRLSILRIAKMFITKVLPCLICLLFTDCLDQLIIKVFIHLSLHKIKIILSDWDNLCFVDDDCVTFITFPKENILILFNFLW